MKFADINKRFTEKVAEYISKGWTINIGTMSGSQTDELGKVDLTDGKQVVRILVEEFKDDMTRDEIREFGWHCFKGVRLAVGKVIDRVAINTENYWPSIFNGYLEVIEEEKFYNICDDRDRVWYGTLEEVKRAAKLRAERRSSAWGDVFEDITDRARDVALNWVKHQPRCKTYKAADITEVSRRRVYREGVWSGTRYKIKARGRSFEL